MMKRILACLLLIGLTTASTPLIAEKLLRDFSGSRSQYTASFPANDPWLIDWRITSPNPRAINISITLIDARTDSLAGRVVQTAREGDGLRLMNESGVFRFRVDAREADWAIKVIQLNRDEARLYKPKH